MSKLLFVCSTLILLLSVPVRAEEAPAAPTAQLPDTVHVTVSGEVKAPGTFALPGNSSINALLALAGGVTDWAMDTVYLTRASDGGRPRRFSINIKDPRRAEVPGWLHEGDTLTAVRGEQFSVVGEVHKPGSYRMDPGMTVQDAIVKAGDVTEFGSIKTATVERLGNDGKKQTIKVKPDDLLEPDDVIRVKVNYFGAKAGGLQWTCRVIEVCSV